MVPSAQHSCDRTAQLIGGTYGLQIGTGYTGYPTRVLWVVSLQALMQWGTLFLDGLCLIGSGHSKGTLSAVLYYGPLLVVGTWRTVRSLLSGCNVRALLSGSK
jgi:hypothetical protein